MYEDPTLKLTTFARNTNAGSSLVDPEIKGDISKDIPEDF